MRLLFILDLAPHPASHLFNAQPSPLPHPCTTREIARRFRQIHHSPSPFRVPVLRAFVAKLSYEQEEEEDRRLKVVH